MNKIDRVLNKVKQLTLQLLNFVKTLIFYHIVNDFIKNEYYSIANSDTFLSLKVATDLKPAALAIS